MTKKSIYLIAVILALVVIMLLVQNKPEDAAMTGMDGAPVNGMVGSTTADVAADPSKSMEAAPPAASDAPAPAAPADAGAAAVTPSPDASATTAPVEAPSMNAPASEAPNAAAPTTGGAPMPASEGQ